MAMRNENNKIPRSMIFIYYPFSILLSSSSSSSGDFEAHACVNVRWIPSYGNGIVQIVV